MIIDLDRYEGGDLTYDICLIGGGAAGVAIARFLSKDSFKVCILESGGMKYEKDTQNLYAGENEGVPYFPLDICRIRQLGGSTNHWGGACWPLEPLDFERKEWLSESGWPINYEELKGYYKNAHEFLALGNYNYTQYGSTRNYENDEKARSIAVLQNEYLLPKFYKTTPKLRFNKIFGKALGEQLNLDLILHANVVEIYKKSDKKNIDSVQIATLGGKKQRVFSRVFVLATGGIENARILLNTYRQQSEGIGNQNDNVGRYFMEHVLMPASSSMLVAPVRSMKYFTHHVMSDSVGVRGGIGFREDTIRRKKLLNTWFGMEISGKPYLYEARDMGKRQGVKKEIAKQTSREIRKYLLILNKHQNGNDQKIQEQNDSIVVNTTCISEQSPNRNSRVKLGKKKDPLDKYRPVLEWKIQPEDYESIVKAHRLLAQGIGIASIGRVLLNIPENLDSWSTDEEIANVGGVYGSHHHMGTTRMSSSEKNGVVNKNCLVYGTNNLYVAGSSVFPTSGYANPTLTVIALALRLADHIKNGLTREVHVKLDN